MTTRGYTLVAPPCPRQTLVHVHPDPDELGRVYQPTLAICAGSAEFLRAAAAMPPVDSERSGVNPPFTPTNGTWHPSNPPPACRGRSRWAR